jgi:TrmH family RNA methyltransferase
LIRIYRFFSWICKFCGNIGRNIAQNLSNSDQKSRNRSKNSPLAECEFKVELKTYTYMLFSINVKKLPIGLIMYKITSAQNPLVKHLCRLRINSDYREEHRRVLIEGNILVREVCAHLHTYTLIATEESLLPKGIKTEQLVLVTEQVFGKISGMHTPEGIAAEVAMPTPAVLASVKRLLVLDGVSDPGNLGALLRTALALGWEAAFLLHNVCDPFNEKTLRAAKGATFRLPFVHGSVEQLKSIMHSNHLIPLVADLKGQSLEERQPLERVLLALGNEAHGPSSEVKALCQQVVIPMSGEMESLNVAVAGGILMYHLTRRPHV